ncbi:MAG: argininosuccinate synthase [Acetobacteraceae bacterium]|nr:argininosuccinate synthase [Acetobacteraceae bacterium]
MQQEDFLRRFQSGLDTTVAVPWLKERLGAEVVTLTVELGGRGRTAEVARRAARAGARSAVVVDGRERFLRHFAFPALAANALYQGVYPLSSALSRPLIAEALVETARRVGARAVAHGCTGKGNDQVRLEVSLRALDPGIEVLAPIRDWPLERKEKVAYAAAHGLEAPVGPESPYSIDENLWGRSIECGLLEDPAAAPPEDAFAWTASPLQAPDQPEEVEVGFSAGVPVSLDGRRLGARALVGLLNRIAGRHGVGRIDLVEDRLVGIKSREVYECPAAVALIAAHRDLERLTLPRELLALKARLEAEYSEAVYFGLWHSPLRSALDAFFGCTQKAVTGTVRLRLFKGAVSVVGRWSPRALYRPELATYGPDDAFPHAAAAGFVGLWGLPTRIFAQVNGVESLAGGGVGGGRVPGQGPGARRGQG